MTSGNPGPGPVSGGEEDGSTPVAEVDESVVRASYDAVADTYVDLWRTQGMADVRRQPWLRAMLGEFATSVRDLGPVLDVGCGPGQVTAYLRELGVDAWGVDLSPRMIDHARRCHPGVRFEVRSATDLRLEPGSLGGVLGWWSLFNLPRHRLPEVFAAFRAALVQGGQVIVATHVGNGDVHRTEAYGGIGVDWVTHRWQPDALIDLMEAAGLSLVADLRLPAGEDHGTACVIVAERR